MRFSYLRLCGAAVAASAALLAGSTAASAAISCSLAAGTLSVSTDEQLAIIRSGDDIVVTGASCPGGPTISNTNTVIVTGTLDGPEQIDVNESGGAFDGIAFDLTSLVFANGAALIVTGTSDGDTITLGTLGIALDTDGDLDIALPASVGPIRILGGDGNDTISTTGGNGSGAAPSGRNVYASGGAGADSIDLTDGDAGPGADLAEGGPGDDTITGDFADGILLANAPGPAGAEIDIAAGTATSGDGADTFGPLRSVFGTQFADTIAGTNLPDVIFGLGGDDVIDAYESQDTIDGGEGNDDIDAGTGEDVVTGGPGDDVLRARFLDGFAAELDGAGGNNRYELYFDTAAGSIDVIAGGGSDEIAVDCTPGAVTNTPAGTAAGTLSRGAETATYSGVETVTIAPACVAGTSPPPAHSGMVFPTGGGSTAPVASQGATSPVGSTPYELGALIALVDRRPRRVRFDGAGSFLVRGAIATEPTLWSWRIRRARRVLIRDRVSVTLRGAGLARSRVRSRIAIGDPDGLVWSTRADLPGRVRRGALLMLPAATLESPSLRGTVVERARLALPGRRGRTLPRILAAANRALTRVATDERPVAMRIVVTAPRSLRWIKRLERLPAKRLRRAVDGRRIVLARGATLRLVSVRSSSRATIALRRR
jgi:Ca2+-binding RTX toxin-like protein